MAVLVGREMQRAVIDGAACDALRGHGQLVLISGDAGIGKSRLADAAAQTCASKGMQVARGYAVDDVGAPPLWPWLRLARALPDLRAAFDHPGLEREGGNSDVAARFRMFVAVADRLRDLADPAGLLIILEDLHWADASSVLLLQHLVAELAGSRLLVVATFRESPEGALASALPDLGRGDSTRAVRLEGLGTDTVAAWLRAIPELTGWAEVAAQLRERTGGNPLVIRMLTQALPAGSPPDMQMVDRLLAERSDIRGLVVARLSSLSEPARDIIVAASALAERIRPDLLAAVTAKRAEDIVPLLAEAVAARVLWTGPDGLAFTHALVRNTVYAGLLPSVQADLHRRIALALEDTGDPALAGLIAHHWRDAGGVEARGECLKWAAKAAAQARSALAHDEAADFAQLAVDCAREARVAAEELAELLVALATAQFAAGQLAASLRACTEAAQLAEHAGRIDLLAAAALVVHGVGSVDVYRLIRGLCQRALDRLPSDSSPTRARLLAQVATASAEDEGGSAAQRLSAQALEVAEASGDPSAILEAIAARHLSIAIPETVDERIVLADRAVELGVRSQKPMAALWGHLWRLDAAIQLGDLTGLDREISEIDQVARQQRSPVARWHHERVLATRCAMVGDFPAARAHAETAMTLAQRMDDLSTFGMYYAFKGQLAIVRGDPTEVGPGMLDALRSFPPLPLVRLTVPIQLALRGEKEAAFEEFRSLPASFPLGTRWLGTIANVGIAAVLLGDAEVAAQVYELLLPTAKYCNGDGSGAVYAAGSNARTLGDLAFTVGRFDDALRHYADAVAVDSRLGARPFVALSRLGWARALHARLSVRESSVEAGRFAADLALAAKLADQAAAEFRRVDMPGPLKTVAALRERLRADLRPTNPLSDRETEVAGLIGAALTNREIAGRLFLSERTVESHVRSILAKLGFASRTEIATWTVRAGADFSALSGSDH